MRYKAKLGKTYGYLTYVDEAERIVRPSKTVKAGYFVCLCGEEVRRPIQEVLQGSITSCGCMKGKGREDLSLSVYNRLTLIDKVGSSGNGTIWNCLCECGNMIKATTGNVVSGGVKSCGCLKIDKIRVHGMSNTPTWRSWDSMIERVLRPDEVNVEWYKDVTIDPKWLEPKGVGFSNFFEDMGERPEGTTLNRINGAKLYSKETCEWADLSMQSFDQKRSKVNTSGRTGVFQVKETGKWVAVIKKNRKTTQVYRGDSFEEACAARSAAEIEYYGFSKE